ncbi:hypothetical protein [Streptomyces sp. NPDC052015]|uniref:hypothetical protein n=1 Tax=Streptomyces sp. NPDC052015 TaxID=3154755 RepID=UPI003437DF13
MLITPRPGTNRDSLLPTLPSVHIDANNEHGRPFDNAYRRLVGYLEWAMSALRNQVTAEDLAALVLTKRHDTLLNGVGDPEGAQRERLVNLLVDHELAEHTEALEAVIHLLQFLMNRWTGHERFVVPDSSFYIQNPIKLADVDRHQVLGLPEEVRVRLLFPIVVVDELDGLNLDWVLNGDTDGVLHAGEYDPQSGETRGKVVGEMVLDPPGTYTCRLPMMRPPAWRRPSTNSPGPSNPSRKPRRRSSNAATPTAPSRRSRPSWPYARRTTCLRQPASTFLGRRRRHCPPSSALCSTPGSESRRSNWWKRRGATS